MTNTHSQIPSHKPTQTHNMLAQEDWFYPAISPVSQSASQSVHIPKQAATLVVYLCNNAKQDSLAMIFFLFLK